MARLSAAMEKAALEALNWALIFGGNVALMHPQAVTALKSTIRCQFLLFCTKTHFDCLCTENFRWPHFYNRQMSSRDDQDIALEHPRWLWRDMQMVRVLALGLKRWMQCRMIRLSILLANRWKAICDLLASPPSTAHSKRMPWRRSKHWLTQHIG